ncbi:orotidine-5'-phosphate decarboxylase [Methanohalophilus levihalophilus]|uniref:hypothetical protein n=1 Tax=Methanohalophilus levihalophilus TaxID=1431282 RepID=UPI001AE4BEDD|nr:hypothetical protein [Methanohalophilus levihalophilus]MBP2031024.1 orotidine-5'-phosphate decarboxylase [Methanohalophilus levihalophilus]
MRKFIEDKSGASVTMGYIMLSTIFISFFIITHMTADDMLLERPAEIVMDNKFSDVGNMIGTMVTDVYLIAPENGRIETEYLTPNKIAGENYLISAETANADQVIGVTSSSSDKTVNVTLSGITNTIGINGITTSNSDTHRISYDSRK